MNKATSQEKPKQDKYHMGEDEDNPNRCRPDKHDWVGTSRGYYCKKCGEIEPGCGH